jgi:hypothetical protein
LDIRRLKPGDVIAIALSPERQEQQNVRKLRGLPQTKWEELVNLIDANRNTTELEDICRILDLKESQEAEALAARGNMTSIVSMLHDKSSQLMDMLVQALSDGKLCVIDVSQMRGGQSLVLSGLILRRIFDRNQQEFTAADPKTIPTIAVVEEAQSVLNESATAAEPYVAWVKEGRKYDLGALLITQQPGSIPVEILSQGDNWFIFHLLSAADLVSLKRANSHFSEDLLSSLLNEPIPGQGIFWSSVGGKPYPISLRTMSFEKAFSMLDKSYSKASGNTYAKTLLQSFSGITQGARTTAATTPASGLFPESADEADNGSAVDVMAEHEKRAVDAVKSNGDIRRKLESSEGLPWFAVQKFIMDSVLTQVDDGRQLAYTMLPKVLNAICGGPLGWESFRHPDTNKTWVRKKS